LALKTPSYAYRIGIGSGWRWLVLLWSWGSLWIGRERVCRLRRWIRTTLVERVVPRWRFAKLTFKGQFSLLLLLNLVSKDTNIIKGGVLL